MTAEVRVEIPSKKRQSSNFGVVIQLLHHLENWRWVLSEKLSTAPRFCLNSWASHLECCRSLKLMAQLSASKSFMLTRKHTVSHDENRFLMPIRCRHCWKSKMTTPQLWSFEASEWVRISCTIRLSPYSFAYYHGLSTRHSTIPVITSLIRSSSIARGIV